jgi:hypothetical protein
MWLDVRVVGIAKAFVADNQCEKDLQNNIGACTTKIVLSPKVTMSQNLIH